MQSNLIYQLYSVMELQEKVLHDWPLCYSMIFMAG
jgi:hypothetical protein